VSEELYYSYGDGITEDTRRLFFPNPALQTERLADDVLILKEQMKRLNEAFDILKAAKTSDELQVFQPHANAMRVKVQMQRAELLVDVLTGDLDLDLQVADLLDALCEIGLELQPMNFNKWEGQIVSSVALAYQATIAPNQKLAQWIREFDAHQATLE
jgi:hypothetical protein